MNVIDWLVFSSVLILTFASVLWGQGRRKFSNGSAAEVLLMGRRLTLPLFVATLVATWYGGIFGVTQIAFEHGIYNFVTQGGFWYVTYLIFAFFLVDRVRRFRALTFPDLVGEVVGPGSRRLAAIFNFFNVLPIAYVMSIGFFIQIFTGWPLWLGSMVGVGAVIAYSAFTGFRSVVFTDLVQFFVMCLGVFLVLVFSVGQFGGLEFLRAELPASYFSPTGTLGWGEALVWGWIALATLIDPNFYQRCFAAQSTRTARTGILVSTGVWILFDLCTTFGAMYARAAMPDLDSGSAYLTYAMEILPSGVRGLVVAGFLATILSTLDSYLFLAGATWSYDLRSKVGQNMRKTHAMSVCWVGVLAVVLSLFFDGNIREVWKLVGSYFSGCLLLPVLLSLWKPGLMSDRAFVNVVAGSALTMTAWRFWGDPGVPGIYIGLGFSVLSILGISVRWFGLRRLSQ